MEKMIQNLLYRCFIEKVFWLIKHAESPRIRQFSRANLLHRCFNEYKKSFHVDVIGIKK